MLYKSIHSMQAIIVSITIVACVFLTGCQSDYFYEDCYVVENEKWDYDSPASFEVDITDTSKKYNIYAVITYQKEFSFQNLYVRFSTQIPNGVKVEEDVSLQLANKLGQWIGDCSNTHCTQLIPLQTNLQFMQAGKHVYTIAQHMRINPMKGIKSICLKLETIEYNGN